MHSADHAVARCLSVCLCVTRRYSVETVIHILKLFLPSGIHTILVFAHRTVCLYQYSDGDLPNGGLKCKEGMKKSRFLTNLAFFRK